MVPKGGGMVPVPTQPVLVPYHTRQVWDCYLQKTTEVVLRIFSYSRCTPKFQVPYSYPYSGVPCGGTKTTHSGSQWFNHSLFC